MCLKRETESFLISFLTQIIQRFHATFEKGLFLLFPHFSNLGGAVRILKTCKLGRIAYANHYYVFWQLPERLQIIPLPACKTCQCLKQFEPGKSHFLHTFGTLGWLSLFALNETSMRFPLSCSHLLSSAVKESLERRPETSPERKWKHLSIMKPPSQL